jgi:hypothetical protein
MGKKSRSGSRVRTEHPRSYFRELKNYFWGLKTLKSSCADPDPGSEIFLTLDPVSGMEKFGSGINIPDPQHCLLHREKNDKKRGQDSGHSDCVSWGGGGGRRGASFFLLIITLYT